jgi:hypothetical protein
VGLVETESVDEMVMEKETRNFGAIMNVSN